MQHYSSPADPLSRTASKLRQQASTPTKRKTPLSSRSRNEGMHGSRLHVPSTSSKKTPSRVTFSPQPIVQAPASPHRCNSRFESINEINSPYSPCNPNDAILYPNNFTPLTISPSSTVKRALCDQWDKYNKDFKDAILEQEIQYRARLQSVRSMTCVTVAMFLFYLVIGTCYYSRWSSAENKWPMHESLIFLIYTCSTVGYGNHDIPSAPSDRVATMVFIMVGIGLVTVLLSEIFQYMIIITEKVRFTHEEKQNRMRASITSSSDQDDDDVENQTNALEREKLRLSLTHKVKGAVFNTYALCRYFIARNTAGRYLVNFIPFLFLIVFGASVVGNIEGWSWIDSLYWATVTLTTVGYGDLTPSSPVSIWFCIFFLPISTIFLSLYLSKIAGAYMRLHISQIKRIEMKLEKMHQNMEKKEDWPDLIPAQSGETDMSSPSQEVFEDPPRRQHLVEDKSPISRDIDAQSFATEEDVAEQTHTNRQRALSMRDLLASTKINEMNKSTRNLSSHVSPTPSLGLRARVQARLAYIVSTELCMDEPKIELRESEIHLILSSWKRTVEKWKIPKKAKDPLKSLSCEIILSVGVTVIREQGVDALLELNSETFQRSFNPVLAAFGHADCMEGWIKDTDHLM